MAHRMIEIRGQCFGMQLLAADVQRQQSGKHQYGQRANTQRDPSGRRPHLRHRRSPGERESGEAHHRGEPLRAEEFERGG